MITYDYFLTLPLEISEIWTSRFSFTTLLYFMNRYGMLINALLQLLWTFIPSPGQKVSINTLLPFPPSPYRRISFQEYVSELLLLPWCQPSSDLDVLLWSSFHSHSKPLVMLLLAVGYFHPASVTVPDVVVSDIFVLRTAAIYQNNWIIIAVLGFMTSAKSAIFMVRLSFHAT